MVFAVAAGEESANSLLRSWIGVNLVETVRMAS
jgi:hypothetical protein